MTIKNEFQPFGTGVGALVKTPDEYQSMSERASGFTNGVADPAKVNTALRQPSMASAMIGEIILNGINQSALDNGDVTTLRINFLLALRSLIGNITSPLTDGPVVVKSASVLAPPANPEVGDCYIIPEGPTGDWDGYDFYVTEWDGLHWLKRDYKLSSCVFVQDIMDIYRRISGGWRSLEATLAEMIAGSAHNVYVTPYNLAQRLQTLVPGVYEGDYPPPKADVAPGSIWTESDTALVYLLILSGGNRHWVEKL